MLFDGVFVAGPDGGDGKPVFHALPRISDTAVADLLQIIRTRVMRALIVPDQRFSHGAHFGLAVAGVALAGLTIACLPRARTPLVGLLAFDLVAALASTLLEGRTTSGAVGFSLVVLALSAAGLLASFQKGFGLFLAQLSERGRDIPRGGSSVT